MIKKTRLITSIAGALVLGTAVLAEERPEPLTGTRILDRMQIVFDTSPILLASATGAMEQPSDASITFILDPELTIAAELFTRSEAFATDQLVTHLRSLTEVRQHLAQSDSTYDLVNLVAHGAAQTGMRVAVIPGGPDAHVQTLRAGTGDADLVGRIDGDTIVRLYSCTVGADPAFLRAMEQFFAADDVRPVVQALDDFIEFADANDPVVAVREGLAVVAPTRSLARRAIERKAYLADIALPHAWQRRLDTRPLEIGIRHSEIGTPIEAATRSPEVQRELERMQAATDDFSWQWSDGILVGTAVIGIVHLDPGPHRSVLDNPERAQWIASR